MCSIYFPTSNPSLFLFLFVFLSVSCLFYHSILIYPFCLLILCVYSINHLPFFLSPLSILSLSVHNCLLRIFFLFLSFLQLRFQCSIFNPFHLCLTLLCLYSFNHLPVYFGLSPMSLFSYSFSISFSIFSVFNAFVYQALLT